MSEKKELVGQKRGGKRAPPEWMIHHRLKDALKTYNEFLRDRRKAVKRRLKKEDATPEEIRKRIKELDLEDKSLDEFAGIIQDSSPTEFKKRGLKKSRRRQTTLDLGPRFVPWGTSHTFLMRKIKIGSVPDLRDRLKGMKFMKGMRAVYKDFRAGEQVASGIPSEVNALIEEQGKPEWPGESPEQIAVMVKTRESYQLKFVKATQYAGTEDMYTEVRKRVPKRPRQIVDGHIWIVPKATVRKTGTRAAYPIARVILGRDPNAVTHNQSAEMYKLTPA